MNRARRHILALVCAGAVLAVTGCGSSNGGDTTDTGTQATTSPSASAVPIRTDAVPKAALSIDDVGSGWSTFDVSAVEGCTKIGGKICVDNVPGRVSFKTEVAYRQPEQKGGYIANAVLLMAVEDDAGRVIDELREAAKTTQWSQSFSAGDATYKLAALPFDKVGDETFAVRIDSTAKNRNTGAESSREIDYIVFRSGRVLSFVYVIRADSAALARKSATKIEALVSGEL